jgi:hypothetical protein
MVGPFSKRLWDRSPDLDEAGADDAVLRGRAGNRRLAAVAFDVDVEHVFPAAAAETARRPRFQPAHGNAVVGEGRQQLVEPRPAGSAPNRPARCGPHPESRHRARRRSRQSASCCSDRPRCCRRGCSGHRVRPRHRRRWPPCRPRPPPGAPPRHCSPPEPAAPAAGCGSAIRGIAPGIARASRSVSRTSAVAPPHQLVMDRQVDLAADLQAARTAAGRANGRWRLRWNFRSAPRRSGHCRIRRRGTRRRCRRRAASVGAPPKCLRAADSE